MNVMMLSKFYRCESRDFAKKMNDTKSFSELSLALDLYIGSDQYIREMAEKTDMTRPKYLSSRK